MKKLLCLLLIIPIAFFATGCIIKKKNNRGAPLTEITRGNYFIECYEMGIGKNTHSIGYEESYNSTERTNFLKRFKDKNGVSLTNQMDGFIQLLSTLFPSCRASSENWERAPVLIFGETLKKYTLKDTIITVDGNYFGEYYGYEKAPVDEFYVDCREYFKNLPDGFKVWAVYVWMN